jgi:LacI family transcriptional regulator, gluconate utilization system Gnt-I transcriptional repressor
LEKSGGKGRRQMVRVEDVARVAGVSPITVSRALSNPSKVKEETRQRVKAAVAQTGYVVNSFASSLRSGHSTIISAFVSNLQNPHFATALQGCADALEGSRYHLLMAQTGYSDTLQRQMLEQVMPFRPAAALFTGLVQSEETRETLRRFQGPVMEMWDYRPDPVDMLVGFSNAGGGRLMGAHFRERGFNKVAYAGRTVDRGAQRLAGFIEGYGRPPALVLPLEGSRTVLDGMQALETIRRDLPGCDAIFFATDLLALGAILKARQLGLSVPEDMAIAGYGDLETSKHLATPLTSVHVSSYDMGHAAGAMLLRRLRNEAIEERIVLSPIRLEVRESTWPGAGDFAAAIDSKESAAG